MILTWVATKRLIDWAKNEPEKIQEEFAKFLELNQERYQDKNGAITSGEMGAMINDFVFTKSLK